MDSSLNSYDGEVSFQSKNIDLSAKSILGEGGCGVVFKGTLNGKTYAVKRLDKQRHNEKYVLKRIGSHPNIVPYLSSFKREGKEYLVFELCEKLPSSMPLKDVKQLARHLLRALNVIHIRHNLRFGDIKKGNVMIYNNHYVLIDFGYCREAESAKGMGTLDYFAPELCPKRNPLFHKANDIWALGVLIFKLLTDRFPFYHHTETKTLRNIRRCYISSRKAWRKLDKETKEFLRFLWVRNPQRRPTIRQVMNHPWLERNPKHLSR